MFELNLFDLLYNASEETLSQVTLTTGYDDFLLDDTEVEAMLPTMKANHPTVEKWGVGYKGLWVKLDEVELAELIIDTAKIAEVDVDMLKWAQDVMFYINSVSESFNLRFGALFA